MNNQQKITFSYQKYYPKWLKSIAGMLCVAAIIVMTYHLVAGLIFLILNVLISNAYFLSTKNRKGIFLFDDDGFTFNAFFMKKRIDYSAIWEIRKEYWEEDKQTVGIDYSQYNMNQYAILLKNNKKLIFRVAAKEEKEYDKARKEIGTKVYGKVPLIGLNKKITPMSKEEEMARDEVFSKLSPEANFSLTKAISLLVEKGCLSFSDQTLE